MQRRVFCSVKEAADLHAGGARFVDARWQLKDLYAGRRDYAVSRLPGAAFFDLEAVSGDPAAGNGRHPLPTPSRWQEWLSSVGITPTTPVVAYDSMSGQSAAARLWWMLHTTGHRAFILAGGIPQWVAAEMPLEDGAPTAEQNCNADAAPGAWDAHVASISDVERMSREGAGRLVDCRSAERYGSVDEPGWPDAKPGHIATAVNHPFSVNYNGAEPKSSEELRAICDATLAGVASKDAVLYCGSGVTACCTAAAMVEAGLDLPRLYVGSWSEWQAKKL